MKNLIEVVRNDIKQHFDPNGLSDADPIIIFSPDNKFRIESEDYRQNKTDVNWYAARIKIFDNSSNEKLFEFFADDTRLFHSWLKVGGLDYLVCAENMCGGQTVINLTHRLMSSFSDGTDGFIWAEFSLSPDGRTLATIGCVWACPYEIKVFDFSDPMDLPLKLLTSVNVLGNETIAGWLDNRSFKTRRIETDVNETAISNTIERIISIDS